MMDTSETLIKIRKIVRSINLESKKIERNYGISIPQALCLSFLQQQDQYIAAQHQIKEHLNLNSSTTSGIIGRLEKKGLIKRMPKSGDKRVNYFALSQEGIRVIGAIPDLLQEKLEKKLAELPDQYVRDINSGLDLLIETLNINNIEVDPFLTISDELLG